MLSVGHLLHSQTPTSEVFRLPVEFNTMASRKETGCCSNKGFHIIPKEWTAYPSATLDCVVYTGLKEHYNHYKTPVGASITIGEVSATAKFHGQYVWMRKESDQSEKPLLSQYSKTMIDNYACKHN